MKIFTLALFLASFFLSACISEPGVVGEDYPTVGDPKSNTLSIRIDSVKITPFANQIEAVIYFKCLELTPLERTMYMEASFYTDATQQHLLGIASARILQNEIYCRINCSKPSPTLRNIIFSDSTGVAAVPLYNIGDDTDFSPMDEARVEHIRLIYR